MVAHLLWEQRVAGSNPVAPTIETQVGRGKTRPIFISTTERSAGYLSDDLTLLSGCAWVMELRRRPVSTGHLAFAWPSAAGPTCSRPRESAGASAESHSCVWSLTSTLFAIPHHLAAMVASRSRGKRKAPAVVAGA